MPETKVTLSKIAVQKAIYIYNDGVYNSDSQADQSWVKFNENPPFVDVEYTTKVEENK